MATTSKADKAVDSDSAKSAANKGSGATTGSKKSKTSTSKKSKAKSAEAAGAPKKKKRKKTAASSSKRSSGTSGGGGGASSSSAILSHARKAQTELSHQRALEAARKSDQLWYSTSSKEAFSAVLDDSSTSAMMPSPLSSKGVLEDPIGLVEKALQNNHLAQSDVTPQAFACLLEQARRHALELLADAQDYAYSANRQDVTRSDLLLAAELRPDQAVASTHTQHHKMVVISHQINRQALPPIPKTCYNGIVLPQHNRLTSRTFDVVSGAYVQGRMLAKLPQPTPSVSMEKTSASSSADTSKKSKKNEPPPSYGATRGPQIPIQLKKDADTKGSKPGDNADGSSGGPKPMTGVAPGPG